MTIASYSALQAQFDVQYSHFMYHQLGYNPAFAGAKGVPVIQALYRNQWSGIEGAPQTANINFHMPLFKNRTGLGLSVTGDQIGIVETLLFDLSYAYRIHLKNDAAVAIGLRYRQEFGRINWQDLDPIDIGDESLPDRQITKSNPNFGVGLYYNTSKFYVGVSMPHFLTTRVYDGFKLGDFQISSTRTMYIMGGYLFDIGNNVKFKPAALVSFNKNTPFELDLNASFLFLDALWVGATWRMGDSVDGLLMYELSNKFKIGAAFDLTLTELNHFTPGSFEILLEYCFMSDKSRLVNIRYF